MNRRELLALIGGVMVALRASAGESAAPAGVGFLSGGDEGGAANFVAALRDGLAVEGYHEPETLILERLYADYSLDRVPALVAELERRRVELIVTHAAATPIVVKGYRTVPVVYEFSADPVATGGRRAEQQTRSCAEVCGISRYLSASRRQLLSVPMFFATIGQFSTNSDCRSSSERLVERIADDDLSRFRFAPQPRA
jgi:hypothetical protein